MDLSGLSTNRDSTAHAASLKEAGINFIARYYSRGRNVKNLTASEALALSTAGLLLVAVYENSPTRPEYFSFAVGHNDGVDAYHYANLIIHQPPNSTVYFAVDFDAPRSVIAGSIKDYFDGVNRGFNDASNGNPSYSIGVYGSGATCDWCLNHLSFMKHTWLAESTGWIGSKSFTRWNIKQSIIHENELVGGFGRDDGEENISQGDFGAFQLLA